MGYSFNIGSYFSRLKNCVLDSVNSEESPKVNHNYKLYKLYEEGAAIDINKEARKLGKSLARESNQAWVCDEIPGLYLSGYEIAAADLFSALREIVEIDAYCPDEHIFEQRFINFIYDISNSLINSFEYHCNNISQYRFDLFRLFNTETEAIVDMGSSKEQ